VQLSPEVLYGIAAVLALIGLAGTFLPVLPGVPLVFAGMVLAAYAGGFARVSKTTLIILGLLTIFALLLDFLAASVGAQRVGASRAAIVGAGVGAVIGLFMGPFGLLLGAFIGAVGGELLATNDAARAGRVGIAAWIGLLLGTLFKLALTFAMVGIFVTAWLID
jgi:uncharacterized protein YqgC (DUF456 family)